MGRMYPERSQEMPTTVATIEVESRRLYIGDGSNANTGELQDILDERAEDWYNSMPTQEEEARLYGYDPDREFALY